MNIIFNYRERRTRRLKEAARSWQLYVFLLIPLIYILIFCYYPMAGAQIAFKKYNMTKGIWGSDCVGLDNFQRFFASYQFRRIIVNTLVISFYTLLASFPVPILLALGLNSMRSERYRKLIQNIIYIPHFISVIVLIGILYQMMNPRTGVYGMAYSLFKLGEYAPNLVGRANTFRHFYVWSGVWQNMGWSSIIYIAALSGVDRELHEAAQIDGASRFRRLLHVDIPHVLPTISIMLILRMGSIMSVGFDKVYLMQNNLNLVTSEVISTYVYKVAMASGTSDFSYATAIGMFNSVINLLMLAMANAMSKRLSQTSLW
jgi:putative aldouronate transport system permease protein